LYRVAEFNYTYNGHSIWDFSFPTLFILFHISFQNKETLEFPFFDLFISYMILVFIAKVLHGRQ